MICDGLEEISLNGFGFLEDSGKPKIMLSWITYASALFNSGHHKSIDDLLTKVQEVTFSKLLTNLLEVAR